MFHSETGDCAFVGQKQKGGENSFVLTSRGGGVLLDNASWRLSRPALPGRSAASLATVYTIR